MEKNLKLTHAKQMYYSSVDGFRDIALEYYSEDQLKRAALPTSWDELSSEQKRTTKEDNDALHALAKVKDLLNLYNGDWVPDWTGSHGTKYCLIAFAGEIITSNNSDHACALSFKSPENRKHFLTHHLALIKQAAPLLWGVSFEDEIKVIGFVVKFKGGDGLYFGCTANHADISTLVAASDVFASYGHAHQFVSEHGDKRAHSMIIQKLTIHKDGTHLLEDIEIAADDEQ